MEQWTKLTTKIVCNILLLVMGGIWAWVSVKKVEIVPLTPSFIALAGVLVSGDVANFLNDKLGKKNDNP